MTLKFRSVLPIARSSHWHKSHLRRGGRTWYPDSNWNCTQRDLLKKLSCTTGHISFLKVLQILPRRAIPVQSCSSFDWVGGHRPNVVKVRKAILHHRHNMSWTIRKEKCLLSYSQDFTRRNGPKQPPPSRKAGTTTNIKTWTYWQSTYDNLSKSLHSFLVFRPLELISQSLQPFQNRAKDPKRKSCARHLHFAAPTTLRFGSLLNWRSCAPHKSHLRRGGRTWYPDSNWNCTERDIFKNWAAQRATFHS